jgi:hypothetical protein
MAFEDQDGRQKLNWRNFGFSEPFCKEFSGIQNKILPYQPKMVERSKMADENSSFYIITLRVYNTFSISFCI